MQKIIASYLVQKKECSLPGIGHFKINLKPAEHDADNKRIIPPACEITCTEDEVHLRKDLVTYVSHRQQIHEDHAAENISIWCGQAKERLDAGERIYFQSLGTLQKDEAGKIYFETKNETRFFDAIRVEKALHKNAGHAVLVGDRETTSAEMNEFYKVVSTIEKRSSWKIWALVLFIVSFLILILHFSRHSLTTTGVGNQAPVAPVETRATYELK